MSSTTETTTRSSTTKSTGILLFLALNYFFLFAYLIDTSDTSATPPIIDMDIISTKTFEEICKIPVLIGTIVCYLLLIPLKIIVMYTLFLKLDTSFSPNHRALKQHQGAFVNRISSISKY
jgi:hypothetical protein